MTFASGRVTRVEPPSTRFIDIGFHLALSGVVCCLSFFGSRRSLQHLECKRLTFQKSSKSPVALPAGSSGVSGVSESGVGSAAGGP